MPRHQIEMLLANPAAPVHVPQARPGIGNGPPSTAAKELSCLPASLLMFVPVKNPESSWSARTLP